MFYKKILLPAWMMAITIITLIIAYYNYYKGYYK